MKISKRSWHYKLHDERWPPKTLCTYFWLTVFKSALLVGVAGVMLGGIGCAVYLAFVLTNIGWMLLPVGGLTWLGVRRWLKRASSPPKPPGVVRSYLRAKKERVCPLIEYTA